MLVRLTLVFILMCAIGACKGNDDTPQQEESTEPYAFAIINGVEHQFNYYSASTDFVHYTLYFACCEGQGIDLEFAGTVVGKYNVGGNSNSVFVYYTKDGITYTSPRSPNTFSGTITKIDATANTVSGSFEFEGCTNTGQCIKITKGVFKNIPIAQ